jgi:hypothetical protein
VGSVGRARGELHTVELLYLDQNDPGAIGLSVSNVSAEQVAGPPGKSFDPLEAHLLNFVTRFEPGLIARFAKRRSRPPFALDEFNATDALGVFAGMERGVQWFVHRDQPLQILRTVIRGRGQMTDVAVCGWNTPVRDVGVLVEPATEAFACAFDSAAIARPYPPPEWDR